MTLFIINDNINNNINNNINRIFYFYDFLIKKYVFILKIQYILL